MLNRAKCISQASSLKIIRAKGSYVYSSCGRKVLDMGSGIGSNVLGHGHPAVLGAILGQCQRVIHVAQHCYDNECVDVLNRELGHFVPKELDTALYCLSGSEGIDHATKIAKMYNKKRLVLSFSKGFHGRTTTNISLGDVTLRHQAGPNVIIPDYISMKAEKDIPSHILDSTSALIIEPIQGERGGYHSISPRFLKYLRRKCNQHGIVMIVDEVQTFLRTGTYFGNEVVVPDMAVVAKGLANSLPLSAVIGKSRVMNNIPIGVIGGTFQGNCISLMVASEVLRTIREEKILENVKKQGVVLRNGLRDIRSKNSHIITDVRGKGLMVGIEYSNQRIANEMFNKYLRNNIFVMKTSYPSTLRLIPPLNIKDAEVSEFLDCTQKIISV